jgi:hypothetical protein
MLILYIKYNLTMEKKEFKPLIEEKKEKEIFKK